MRLYHYIDTYYSIYGTPQGTEIRRWRQQTRKAGAYVREVWKSREVGMVAGEALITKRLPSDLRRVIEERYGNV